MDPARWSQMRRLVQAVGELPRAEREAALRAGCGDDEALFQDLRGLLDDLGGESAQFGGIVADALSRVAEPVVEGRRLGPYRIVREIGRGGMGAVYLADRVDGQFEQRVALKLIKPGLDTEQFLRRFRAERQILAHLQHPNIARLLDGGVDDEGRPYFAMEWVEGEPVDRYSETHGLDVEQRLALFVDVCGAVMHAHANLVVHRDLKPAHVLVTADRQVRLLDFGIAKVLTEDDAGPGLTLLGVRALTPEYASPEQVRSEPVGTASDVYSLGVILYELLTGARPYAVDSRSPAELERIVCDTEPPRPSSRSGLRRLRGDLDVICLKALQKDPERRYGSVEALRDDIRRSLDGLPVRARPDSVAYRVGKFTGRHRVGVAATVAGITLFAAFLGYHAMRLADERDRARQEAAKAEQVATFLRGLFEVSDPSESKGRTITARELLDEGATRIERELTGQPEVRASMMRVIAGVQSSLGLHASAKPLFESALAEYRRIHADSDHEDVAGTETDLALTLQSLGDVTAAEPLFRRALATRQRLFEAPHEKVSDSLGRLSFLLETNGDVVDAERLAREAMEMNLALFPADDPRIAKSTADLAGLLRRQGRADEAEPLLRRALDSQRRHYGDTHLTVASTIRNLASLLRDSGELDEADALYREAIATRRTILGDKHEDVAIALNSHALLLNQKGDPAAAAAALRESINISEQAYQGQPHPSVAAGYSNLAGMLLASGNADEATGMYGKAIRMVDQVLAPAHPNRAFARVGLAVVYSSTDRHADAEPLFREALAIRRGGLAPGHRYIGDVLVHLGSSLTGLRRFREAEKHLLEAQALFDALPEPDDERTARVRARLDDLYGAWDPPTAVTVADRFVP